MLAFLAAMALGLASDQETLDDPTTCKLIGQWEAVEGRKPTVMLVRQTQTDFNAEDNVVLLYMNEDWSIKVGDKLGEIKVTAPDGSWLSSEAVAVDNGFGLEATFEHVKNLFDSIPAQMLVTRQGKKVDNLSLSGLYSEWSDFKRCRDKKVAVREENKRIERLKKFIPKDPFAK